MVHVGGAEIVVKITLLLLAEGGASSALQNCR